MDRRNYSKNRGDPKPYDHEHAVEECLNKIHCRNGKIYGLADFRNAYDCEKMTFAHKMRKVIHKVKSLEELSYRDSGFGKKPQGQFDTEDLALKQGTDPKPYDHKDTVEESLKKLHCRNGKIFGWADLCLAYDCEKMTFAHKMRKEMDKVKSLEEALSYRDSGFEKKPQAQFDTGDLFLKQSTESEVQMIKKQVGKKPQAQFDTGDLALKQSTESEVQMIKKQVGKKPQAQFDTGDLALKQSTESEVQMIKKQVSQLDDEKRELVEKLSKMEMKLKEVEQKKEELAEKHLSSQKMVKQLIVQLKEQEEKFSQKLADKDPSWEPELEQMSMKINLMVRNNSNLEKEFQALKDKMGQQKDKFPKVLDEKNLSLETELEKVEIQLEQSMNKKTRLDLKNKDLEKEVQDLKDDRTEQEKKVSKEKADIHQSWEAKFKVMEKKLKEVEEEKETLAQKNLSWEATEKKRKDERKVLDDLFFKKANEERILAVRKMLSRKLKKAMKKGAKWRKLRLQTTPQRRRWRQNWRERRTTGREC
ncbi:hypothetical protein NQZ68_035902 [Dissostichus eleginoides]|nr:hypothetical protein NQZ68_035902 [Dissostichus eleginoides]